jgi:CheY-like chemotaxis protein
MDRPLCLIIEDDPSSAKLYARLLDTAGYDSRTCSRYEEALQALDEVIPNVIILDLRLFQRNRGEEIMARIKSDPSLDSTRVIVISAYSTLAKELEDDANMIIIKPINARSIIEILREYVI